MQELKFLKYVLDGRTPVYQMTLTDRETGAVTIHDSVGGTPDMDSRMLRISAAEFYVAAHGGPRLPGELPMTYWVAVADELEHKELMARALTKESKWQQLRRRVRNAMISLVRRNASANSSAN